MAALGGIALVVGVFGGIVLLVFSLIKKRSKKGPLGLIVIGLIGFVLAMMNTDTTVTDFQAYMKTEPQFSAMVKKYYALPKDKQTDVWEKAIEGHKVKVIGKIVYSGNTQVLVLPSSRYTGQAIINLQGSKDEPYSVMVRGVNRMTVGHRVDGIVKLTSRGSTIKKTQAGWTGDVQ